MFSLSQMIRWVCLLLWGVQALSSYAAVANKVYLLVSIHEPSVSKFEARLNEFSRIIQRHLAGENIIQYRDVSAYDLYKIVTDPETKALFWISHGGDLIAPGSREYAIYDRYQNRVDELFALAHANLEFMGIISCDSSRILHSETTPSTPMWTSSQKIRPTTGLKKAIAAYQTRQPKPLQQTMEAVVTNKLQINRLSVATNYHGPLRVRINDRTIGYLEGETTHLALTNLTGPSSKIDLVVDQNFVDHYYSSQGSGEITIEDDSRVWEPKKTRSGRIMQGIFQTYYPRLR